MRRAPRFLGEFIAISAALANDAFAQSSAQQVAQLPVMPATLEVPLAVDLAGFVVPQYPHFRRVDGFHAGQGISIALDTWKHAEFAGRPCEIYVVADKTAARWRLDPRLVDVRGATQIVNFALNGFAANSVTIDNGALAGDTYDRLGRGYDVVLDFDFDGELDAGDVIDGYDGPGLWVLGDTTVMGPHPVTEILYSGGALLGQDLYFPSDFTERAPMPLVVISHGNGHDYRWYDHLGTHLASWGAVVMSHQNNTGPGPEAASATTLANTEFLLANLPAIAGGLLQGRVDARRIVWIGHSRGGEGVVRAFRRLKDGQASSPEFTWRDIALITALAPTTQLPSIDSDPGVVPFALFFGGADTDVSSAPFTTTSKPFALYERAEGDKHALYLQGAGHADFHAGGGPCWCAGPALIGMGATHTLLGGYTRALVELYAHQRAAARELLTRSYRDFGPPSIPGNVVAALETRDAPALGAFVVEDFESEPDFAVSSSGGAVAVDAVDYYEGELVDFDGSLAVGLGTPMNGMCLGRRDDSPHGAVVEWSPGPASFVEFQIAAANGDVRGFEALSLRAAQATRHVQTDTLAGPLSFTVTLRDRFGRTASIASSSYGQITQPYQRTGVGPGAGWINEFSTLRIPLADFASGQSQIELGAIRAVRLELGGAYGSPRGRIGIDDVEFVVRRTP